MKTLTLLMLTSACMLAAGTALANGQHHGHGGSGFGGVQIAPSWQPGQLYPNYPGMSPPQYRYVPQNRGSVIIPAPSRPRGRSGEFRNWDGTRGTFEEDSYGNGSWRDNKGNRGTWQSR